jgi:carbamate kinase
MTDKLMMHPTGFEMIRHLDEELREISLRKFWWRHVKPDPEPERITEAEVIELVFGPQCEAEGSIGA